MMEYFGKLTNEQLANIRNDLGEDINRMENNIKLLQEWIQCQRHLPQTYDNNMLSTFLRGCKHDMERTKRKFEVYFISRTKVPEFYQNREATNENLDRIHKQLKSIPLPKLTLDGNRVTIFKVINKDATDMDMKEFLRYVFMTADLRVAEETPIAGDIFVFDIANITITHCIKFITPLLHQAFKATQEAYPVRIKAIHILNAPKFSEKTIAIVKQMSKEKIRNRFFMHSKQESLLEYIPKEVLPLDYGGTEKPFDELVEIWKDILVKRNKWFQQQDSVIATNIPNELNRKCGYVDHIGIEGTFRKLEID